MAGAGRRRELSPTLVFPAVSAAVLIGGFLIYYFPVTTRQEAAITDRAMRHLAAASDQVRNRIVTYAGVLEQVTNRPLTGAAPSEAARDRERRNAGEAARPPVARAAPEDQIRQYLAEQVPDLRLAGPIGAAPCDRGSATATLVLASGQHAFEFVCTRTTQEPAATWRARVPLERMVVPSVDGLPEGLFDEILVADGQGAVLYQTRRTGMRVARLPAEVFTTGRRSDTGNGTPIEAPIAFTTTSQMSSLATVSVGGTDYRVFLVPVSLQVTGAAAGSGATSAPAGVVLAGFVRQSRIRAESMAIPGTVLVAVILLLLIVMAATWPLLKFRSMRATERVPRRTLQYFWLSMVTTIALVCVFAFHVAYVFDHRRVDHEIQTLASAIERHLKTEVRQALAVMDGMRASPLFTADATGERDAAGQCIGSDDQRIRKVRSSLLTRGELQLEEYPYFDRVFWANDAGLQDIKWDNSRQSTSQVNVRTRAYFQGTIDNRLWSLAGAPPGATRFRIDPIFSWNTGEYLAVISRPAPPPGNGVCPVNLRVESMVTPLMSLIDPVLPPDYGFAVIDEAGQVLFHSTATRNGQEDLFVELDDSRELRNAVFAKIRHPFTARYIGTSHRFLTMPPTGLEMAPWSLVVFHDLSARSAQHLERVVLFAALVLGYYALIGLLLLLPAAAPVWVRLDEGRRGTYLQLSLALALLAGACYFLIFDLPLHLLPAAGAVMPFAGLGLAIFALAGTPGIRLLGLVVAVLVLAGLSSARPGLAHAALIVLSAAALAPPVRRGAERLAWPSGKQAYAGVWTLALLLGGILPTVAFFKTAYDYHENLSARRQQLQTLAALAAREARVKQRYAGLDLSDRLKAHHVDVGQWIFLRRRLEQTLDRYDTAVLTHVRGTIIEPASRNGAGRSSIWTPDELPKELSRVAAWVPYGAGTLTRQLSGALSRSVVWRWDRSMNRLRIRASAGTPDDVAMSPATTAGDIETSPTASAGDVATSPATTALMKALTDDPIFLSSQLVSELPLLERWNPLRGDSAARAAHAPVQEILWAAFVFSVAGVLTFLWISPTLRRIFPDRSPMEPFPAVALDHGTRIDGSLILIVHHPSDATDLLRPRSDVHVVDAADVARGAVDPAAIAAPVVAIDHFDTIRHGEAGGREALALLERLASAHPSISVVLITTRDPVFEIEDGGGLAMRPPRATAAADSDADRWIRALARFRRCRLVSVAPRSLEDEHRLRWLALTIREQVALHQLAHDGWMNHRNMAAFDQLQRRGLLHGDPLDFADPDFRAFVLRTVRAEDRRAWERQDAASLWDGIRLMFVVVVVGVMAAVLFFNQQSILGLAGVGAGVLATFTRLLAEASGFRERLGFVKTEGTA